MSSLLDEKAVNDFNKKNHDEIEADKQYWAIKKGVKRRQTALEQLTKDTYLVKSLGGKQYTAFLSKDLEGIIIRCPCKVDVVFHGRNAYIVDYFPKPLVVDDLETQKKEFKDLGGDY
nr:hypothetical protein [Methanobrevibacter arboriphilus]